MPQEKFRVERLIAIDKYILLVYYTTAHCYQFSIIDEVGKVYSFDLVCTVPRLPSKEVERQLRWFQSEIRRDWRKPVQLCDRYLGKNSIKEMALAAGEANIPLFRLIL